MGTASSFCGLSKIRFFLISNESLLTFHPQQMQSMPTL
jgi:hypothetical protein